MHVLPPLRKTEQQQFFRSTTLCDPFPESPPLIHGTNDGHLPTGAESGFQQVGAPREKRELPIKRKKIRRGWGGRKNRKNRTFSILAANSNGLVGKFDSLKTNINHFWPSWVLVQETKTRKKGCFKL